jgi:hypothetical protein
MRYDDLVTQISIGFTALCALAFVFVYWRLAPWRSSRVGREIMYFRMSMAVVLLYSVVIHFVPGGVGPVLVTIRSIGVAVVGVFLLRQVRMVYVGQKGRQKDDPRR